MVGTPTSIAASPPWTQNFALVSIFDWIGKKLPKIYHTYFMYIKPHITMVTQALIHVIADAIPFTFGLRTLVRRLCDFGEKTAQGKSVVGIYSYRHDQFCREPGTVRQPIRYSIPLRIWRIRMPSVAPEISARIHVGLCVTRRINYG